MRTPYLVVSARASLRGVGSGPNAGVLSLSFSLSRRSALDFDLPFSYRPE